MSNNKQKNDSFLEHIGEIKPLKKSNKNFREYKFLKTDKKIKSKKKGVLTSSNKLMNVDTKIVKNVLKAENSYILKKLKKGRIPINRKIDFHGLSIEKAKKIFFATINECFYFDERCILFVTGKGMKKYENDHRTVKLFHGKIRENFKNWIYEKDVISKILYVTPAGFSHGGDGAFFVYLRKNKH